MWTDLAAQLWPALPLFFLAGACFVVAGAIWWVAIRRHNALVDTPTIPVVVHRDYPLAVDTHPRHLRDDTDTCVIGRVPPYLPALEVRTEPVAVLPQAEGPSLAELDQLAARLRAATLPPHTGPVCPTCGGPWGNCTCHVKAECPLTTDEIRIPTEGSPPCYVEVGGTVDLTEKLKKVTA